MPVCKLTQKFVDTISTRVDSVKDEWFDESLSGFYLEVRGSRRKTWRLRLRKTKGRVCVLNLGDAYLVPYKVALTEARRLKLAQELGDNESHEIYKKKKDILFKTFIQERYLPFIKYRKRSALTDVSILKNHIIPKFGDRSLSAISKDSLTQFHIALRSNGYAPATADRVIILIRYIFNLAIKWDFLAKGTNPAQDFDFFRENNARERFLEKEEVSQLLKSLSTSENPCLLNIVKMLLMTGCRRGEILEARWANIDLQKRRFLIPNTKQGRPHVVPITDALESFLKCLPSYGTSEYLFPNPRTGKPFRSIFYSWDTARKQANLDALRIHDLRHSFASFLVNQGRSLYEVQKLLGHTSQKTTERYSHLSDSSLRDAIGKMSLLLE